MDPSLSPLSRLRLQRKARANWNKSMAEPSALLESRDDEVSSSLRFSIDNIKQCRDYLDKILRQKQSLGKLKTETQILKKSTELREFMTAIKNDKIKQAINNSTEATIQMTLQDLIQS